MTCRQFGPKIVPPKLVLSSLPRIFAHNDKTVRAEGTTLVCNLYAYLGPTLTSALSTLDPPLKPIQLTELQSKFSELDASGAGAGTAKQERLTRAQTRDKIVREAEGQLEGSSGGGDGAAGGEEPEAEMDPMDLMEAKPIMNKLPGEFWAKIASSKWKERKEEALEPLLEILNNTPKLAEGDDYGQLVKELGVRVEKDSNVICVTLAAQCLTGLAKGLRSSFGRYKDGCYKSLLERLKEKKASVVEALAAALDAVFASTTLPDILEETIPYLSHKTPAVKISTLQFLSRALSTTTVPPPKPLLSPFAAAMVSNIGDSNGDVREAAQESFATLIKVVGEPALKAELDGMDDIRKAKVMEWKDKVTVKYKPKPDLKALGIIGGGGGGGGAKKMPPSLAKKMAPKAAPPPPKEEDDMPPPPPPKAAVKKPPASAKKPAAAAPPAKKPPAAAAPPPAKAGGGGKAPEPIKFKMSQEDGEARGEAELPAPIVASLGEGAWKLRLEGMDNLVQWLEGEGAEMEAEVVVRYLRKKPGWKESNFQVYGKMVAAFQTLAERNPTFSKAVASLVIPPMVDKLGDIKLKKPCGDALAVIAEKTSLQFVLSQAYEPIASQKAPKAQADCYAWVEIVLMDFGIVGLGIRDLIECLKNGLKSSNAAVRSSATKALVTLKLFVGNDIMNFVQDLNPQLLTTIQSEFAKVDGAPAPEPIKTSADNAAPSSGGGGGAGGGGGGKGADPLDELFPRVDLEKLVSSSNVSACNDANWKVRKEALENIQSILEANKRLKPNLSDISTAIKQRLGDSNKVVQGLALDILARIANGMNEPFQKYAKTFVAGVCTVLADQKASARAAGVTALTAMGDNAGLECMIGALGTALEVQNPVQRKELLQWLEPRLVDNAAAANYDLTPLGGPIISCLEDRNAEVRKAAQAILPVVVARAGYSYVMDQTNNLKPASRAAVIPMIDAARGGAPDLPAISSNKAGAAQSGPHSKPSARPLSTKPGVKTPASAAPPSPRNPGTRPTSPEMEQPASRAVGGRKLVSKPSKITSPSAKSTQNFAAMPALENEPPLLSADPKFKASRKLKETGPLKWSVDGSVRPDQIDYLHQQAAPHFSASLLALLFSKGHHADKDFLSGVTLLDDCLTDPMVCEKYDVTWEEMKGRFFANSDIILKYVTVRFTDTNTTIAIKCIELLEHFLAVTAEEEYTFSDYEAQILLGGLVAKVGDSKETIRQRIRDLFHAVCRLYPFSKVFTFLGDVGLKSKNARCRSECAEELASMLQKNGMSCCHHPEKAFPALAALISDRDPSTRNAALTALSQAYVLINDELFSYIGKLPDKDQTMLNERLKRTPSSPSKSGSSSQLPTAPSSRPESRTGLRKSIGIARLPASAKKRSSIAIPNGDNITAALQEASNNATTRLPTRPPSSGISRLTPKGGFGMRPQSMYQAATPKQRAPSPPMSEPEEPQHDNEVENAITEIFSSDPNRSTDALKAIQKMISVSPDMLRPASTQLTDAITVQMNLAFEGLDASTSQSILRLCKHLMQTLSTFFDQKSLARSVDRPSLSRLLAELTKRLLETADNSTSESIMSLSKVLNMVLIRIFHHADQSTCFGALFSVLETATVDLRELRGPTLQERAKYAELVMKCLWKISKTVKESLESEALDPKVLLLDIDQFLQVIPPAEWRRRSTDNVPLADMPLRTVKTILQQVVSVMGDAVYDELSLIDSPENSFVYQYLFRLLNNSK
ncbi:ARM repeat-containing protein, partial [Atractiella rhizophila]